MHADATLILATLDEADEAYRAALQKANINPRTGLATDYLNHFNEVVMLVELLPSMPELREDILAWSPASYAEHFQHTGFRDKDLAIEAYGLSPARFRVPFDGTIARLDGEVTGLQKAIIADLDRLPENAALTACSDAFRLSIAQASAIVNGGATLEIEAEATQDTIDDLFG